MLTIDGDNLTTTRGFLVTTWWQGVVTTQGWVVTADG